MLVIVYSAGSYVDGKRDSRYRNIYPCYWQNEKNLKLTVNGKDAKALAISIIDRKVYTSGYYSRDKSLIACYWMGNRRIDLESRALKEAGINAQVILDTPVK